MRRRWFVYTLVSLGALAPGCAADRAPAPANAPGETLAYKSDPDPFPHLALTPGQTLCPPEQCALRPPVPIVLPLSDGALIGGGYHGDILRVDANGNKTGVLGRQGKGPGEYGMTAEADVDDEGMITVLDMSGFRRLRFDQTGKHISTTLLPRPVPPENPIAFVVRGSKLYLMTAHNQTSPTEMNATISSVTEDGRSLVPLFHTQTSTHFNAGGGMPIAFFRPFPVLDVDRSGALYSSDASAYVIRKVSDSGVQLTISVDVKPAAVESADIAARSGRLGKPMEGGPSARIDAEMNSQAALQIRNAAATAPRVFPVLSRLRILPDNTLWVRRYAGPRADSARWDMFTAAGKPFGTITTSIAADIRAGDAHRVLILDADSLDVPVIRWYAVRADTSR